MFWAWDAVALKKTAVEAAAIAKVVRIKLCICRFLGRRGAAMRGITDMRAESYALNAARAATVIAPFVLFLALPPFYNGIWGQVEGAMPWLHLAAGVILIGLGGAAFCGNSVALDALRHPVVLLPAALFTLTLLLLPMVTLPAVSLLGAPEHGFGALAFLDLAALTAGAIVTLRAPRGRTMLVLSVLVTTAGGFALDLLHRRGLTSAPFFFSDYLAFYAIGAAVVMAVLAGERKLWLLTSYALLGLLVILADNRTAILALVIASALIAILPRRMSGRTAVIICCLVPIAIGLAAALFGETWQESFRDNMIALVGRGFISNAIASLWASLWSRAMLDLVAVQPMLDAPVRLLVGMGWGHYNEALLANLPIVQSSLSDMFGETRNHWDAIERVDFHSHNQYLEAVFATGIVGGLLFLAYGPALVTGAAPERRRLALFAVLFLATLQTFWFQLPHSLPIMAVMAAMLIEGGPVPAFRHLRNFVPAGATLAGCVLTAAAVASNVASTNVWAVLHPADGAARELRRPSFAAGLDEVYEAWLLQSAFGRLGDGRGASARDRNVAALHDLLLDAETAQSLRLRVAEVNVISGLKFRYPAFEERYGSLDPMFERAVGRLLDAAPRRADLVAPYFDYLLASGREREVLALANRILATRRGDPIALWFAGIVLIGDPVTTPQGVAYLSRSLDGRVEDFMPVPAATITEIRQMTGKTALSR